MKLYHLMTKDAIEQRRSIRRFKPDPIPNAHVRALIDAARLAPSSSNTQPWRFRIITEAETRRKLAAVAYQQSFIAEAPSCSCAVLICSAPATECFGGATILNGRPLLREALCVSCVTELLS